MNARANRILCLFLTAHLFTYAAQAQPAATQPFTSRRAVGTSMKSAIGPAPKHAGFAMDGYFVWCSSVIKVGDTYHMFASRWPAEKGLNGWTTLSECVRATS